MRAAVIQMNTTADRERNLEAAERLLRAAVADGARLAVLPEKWSHFANGAAQAEAAEGPGGPALAAARGWAVELGITLVAGSITTLRPGDAIPFNLGTVIGPDGATVAEFSKVHLFDVEAGGVAYRDSDFEAPGDRLAVTVLPGQEDVGMGIGICYDLRFPEMFRAMSDLGADLFALPSGFTAATGRFHWEPLVRARAIENQAFVLAANQVGRSGPDLDSWGHSMIVDPWGEVLAEIEEGEGFACADLDFGRQREIRDRLPALSHRRRDLFGGDLGA